jgi:hypothetical protein
MMRTIHFVLISVTIGFILSSPLQFIEGANSLKIFPPNSKPYGLSYNDHVKNFWKWLASMPIDINPMKDVTGENCSNGQSSTNSSIFYLSGGGGGEWNRVCKVPAGMGLLIPTMTVEVSTNEVEEGKGTPEQLDKAAKEDQDSVNALNLKINNDVYPFANLSKYRTHTDLFDIVFPKDGIFGAKPGPGKAVADGYYIITQPLDKGNYTIEYKGSLKCLPTAEDCEPDSVTFAHDIKYTVIVE